jgi:small conductance mechanosensitive channel
MATAVPAPLVSAVAPVQNHVANSLSGTARSVPDFAKDWPGWVKWLIGVPLQIVIVLIAAVIVCGIGRAVIGHLTKHLAKTSKVGAMLHRDPADAERRAARAKTARSILNSILTFAVWVLAIAICLERMGVNVAVLITSLGVVGVGVGLGAQTLIKDVIAGLFMLIEDQYGVGDVIDAGPATGTVVDMSMRVTTIKDEDGTLWYVPNGQITRIGNKTKAKA